jgi:mannose-6-phosphate isomerase-like protein (cupin superfamily)
MKLRRSIAVEEEQGQMRNRRSLLAGVALASLLEMGCAATAANPRLSLRYEKGLETFDVASLTGRAAPGDVAITNLGSTAWVSQHVAVVRTAEKPHYHRFHDLTVMVLRGEGILNLEQKRIPMKAGDVAHVNRGVPHFFRNTGSGPAVAFVMFSPPFDGRDTVTGEIPEEKAVAPEKKHRWWPF